MLPPPDAIIRWMKLHPKMGSHALPWPERKSDLAAGYDLAAAVDETIYLTPKSLMVVPLGFALALPVGYEAQIRPRSGLASKHWLTMPNSPGTIDADYRGEVKAILRNDAPESFGNDGTFAIHPGMRIAQMAICRLPGVAFIEVADFAEMRTARGDGGFGSTGC